MPWIRHGTEGTGMISTKNKLRLLLKRINEMGYDESVAMDIDMMAFRFDVSREWVAYFFRERIIHTLLASPHDVDRLLVKP